jgi:hypothetical protein
VKIDFVLGLTLVFVPIDVALELTGDIGVLVFTATIIGLLIWLRQRFKHVEKSPQGTRITQTSSSRSPSG